MRCRSSTGWVSGPLKINLKYIIFFYFQFSNFLPLVQNVKGLGVKFRPKFNGIFNVKYVGFPLPCQRACIEKKQAAENMLNYYFQASHDHNIKQ